MALLFLCLLMVTIPSSLFAKEMDTDAVDTDVVNHKEMTAVLNSVVMKRLEGLEAKFEEEKREWRKERAEWREERERWQRSLRLLQKENRRLMEKNKEWQNRWETLQARSDLMEKNVLSLQQKMENCELSLQQKAKELSTDKNSDHHPDTEMEDKVKPAMSTVKSGSQQRSVKPPKHGRLVTRSDDVDALQPIVGQMDQRLNQVAAEVEALKNTVREAGTSTFVRWGSSSCPQSTVLVYSGVAGGAKSGPSGSSPTVLCLPPNPVFGSQTLPNHYTELFGAEYHTEYPADTHVNKDPVCAICRTPRPTTIMVPATNRCEDGWTLEYSGYLMGSYPDNRGNHDFVCMDSAFEERMGSEAAQEGVLLYFTVTHCGSLPCPPYVNGKVVTCAVCSK